VGIKLETALRLNMQDTRHPAWVALLKRMRRLIETVIGQLVERFSMEKVRARDLWHLTSQVNRKLLAHTLCGNVLDVVRFVFVLKDKPGASQKLIDLEGARQLSPSPQMRR
jgi:hypothetical protein